MMTMLLDFTRTAIEHYGYAGIFILTFLDQFILPIPVDLLMPVATSVHLSFSTIMIGITGGAFLGAILGYFLGKYLGHPAAVWLFGKKTLIRGETFIKKWGFWGVVLAGIIPFPFKIVTWTAGIFEMPFKKFFFGVAFGLIPRYFITAYAGALIVKTKFYATTEMSAIILGVLQGLTEFLPISSSGHLILLEHFLKLPLDATHLEWFDIFLHGGSLLAIFMYFWREWWQVLKELGRFLKTRRLSRESLLFKFILGTIPAIFTGLLLGPWIGGALRGLKINAVFFILTALFFLYAEWKKKIHPAEGVSQKQAVIIGLAQAVAMLPAVSRSGATIGMGMLLGLKRDMAAKFSFMLGGIGILAANVYALFAIKGGALMPDFRFLSIGVLTAFIFSFISIAWLIRFLNKNTLRPFAFYLLLVGTLMLSFL